MFRSPQLLLLFASVIFAFCDALGRLSVGWWPLDVIIVADAVMIDVVGELLLQLLDAILEAILFLFEFVDELLLLLLELFNDVLLLLLLLFVFELLLFDEIVVAADG